MNILVSYHSPGSIGDLCVLSVQFHKDLEKLIIIVVAGPKEDLADDIGGSIMEKSLGVHGFPCGQITKVYS